MKALIIDGGQAVRSMAAYMLGLEGFEVMQAADIPEVRGILAEGFVPNVIITCQFETGDDERSLRSMKAHHVLKNVPVLLLSAEGELERQMEWKDAGVTCWMTGPFTSAQFLEMVRMMMFDRLER